MKPELGQTIYVFDPEMAVANATREYVGYLGDRSFIVSYPKHRKNFEYFYEDYGKTWFLTLREAKVVLKEKYGEKVVLWRTQRCGHLWLDKKAIQNQGKGQAGDGD